MTQPSSLALRRPAFLLSAALALVVLAVWAGTRIDRPPNRFEVARQLLTDGQTDDAAVLFQDPIWRGVAEYRSGRYDRAAQAFKGVDSTLALYNLGTTLAQRRDWAAAATLLEQVLSLDPLHADARHNLAIVLRAIGETNTDDAADPPEKPTQGDQQSDQSSQQQRSDDGTAGEETEQQQRRQTQGGDRSDNRDKAQQGGQSESGGELTDDEDSPDARGSVVAEGQLPQQQPLPDRNIEDLTLLKNRESSQAAEILLQRIEDDPEKVLRSRFYTIYQRKQQALSGENRD